MQQSSFCLLGLIFCLIAVTISKSLGQELSVRKGALSPEEQLAQFELAEGFTIELVASEEDGIVNPIDLTFDDAGRLWTQTARMYPLDPITDIQWQDLLKLMDDEQKQKEHPAFQKMLKLYKGETNGQDEILVLSNLYSNNESPVQVQTWKEHLTIPMSTLPYKDGAFVAQGSEMFFLKDENNDGVAEGRIPILTGFGFTDTHTMAHSLVRGPGGWVHFSQGALNKGKVRSLISGDSLRIDFSKIARFSLNGDKIELVNAGLNNIWGLQLRHNGQWYAIEANDLGYSVVPMEPQSAFPGIGNDKLRPYQPFVPKLHSFRVGGTGLSGLAFADDTEGSFPSQYDDVAFLANPITSSINAVYIVRHADGSVEAKHLEDLLTCRDDWFRPVNIEFGPDGCLYIADWYNKIVSHNEVPTTHPDRDKSHGRIWRIRHESQKPREIPDFYNLSTEKLPSYLKSKSLWAKRAAWNQIADRSPEETALLISPLIKIVSEEQNDVSARIHALWSLESIHHFPKKVFGQLLSTSNDNLKREVVRSLATFQPPLSDIIPHFQSLIKDRNPQIRAQVLRTLSEIKEANMESIRILVQASKPELEGDEMGGPYERKFERYLARKALEQFPDELEKFLKSSAANELPLNNKLWALLALPDNTRTTVFRDLAGKHELDDLDESTFTGLVQLAEDPVVFKALETVIQKANTPMAYVAYGLDNITQVHSPAYKRLISGPVRMGLSGGNSGDVKMALQAISRFDMDGSQEVLSELFESTRDQNTMNLILKAMAQDVSSNQKILTTIAQSTQADFNTRAAALNILSKAFPEKGEIIFKHWIPELSRQQRAVLIKNYSASKSGTFILLNSLDDGVLTHQDFDAQIIERMQHVNPDEARINSLRKKIESQQTSHKEISQKTERYLSGLQGLKGDPQKGQALFAPCLLCHRVGDQGQDIAPALDGSANRDVEALLTAIIEPNAAVESGYRLYRVTRTDNSVTEGYLFEKSEKGTTIAMMGGVKTFIPKNQISSEGFLPGRSFMPTGLIDHYSPQQIADLVAYIKTLN